VSPGIVNRFAIGETNMTKLILRLIFETEGQDLIEYALLAAFLGIATTASMTALSASFSTEFANVDAKFASAS